MENLLFLLRDGIDQREVIKTYESVIKTMKEQIYSLKSKLAVSEDSIRRYKQIEVAETQKELKESKLALNSAIQELTAKNNYISQLEQKSKIIEEALAKNESEIFSLTEEKEYWKSLASQSPELEITNKSVLPNDLMEKFRENEKSRIRAQEEADFYKSKYEEIIENMHNVKDKLEETDTLKLQQATLKGEFGDIEQQLLKKEEQVKSSNKRFIFIQKKMDKLSKDKKLYEEKTQELENERKKLSEKYQNLASRVKGEERLKGRIKELEENLEAASQEIENLLERLRDSLKRTEELQNIINCETKAHDQTKEAYKRIKIQEKLLIDERDLLANMNSELSIKLNIMQEEMEKTKSPESIEKHEITFKKGTKESAALMRLNHKLEENVSRLENELSFTKEKLQKKEQEVLELELKLNESHRERRKLEQRQRDVPRDSIAGLIKCLDKETDHPISALSCDNNNLLLHEMNEKYDRLLDKYQAAEEAKTSLESQLNNYQHMLKSMKTQINEDAFKNSNFEKILAERNEEITTLKEKISMLEDKVKYFGISAETERHREISHKPVISRAGSLQNLTERRTKARSNTPDDAATPRYYPMRSNSLLKLRVPSQTYDKPSWRG
ncbi:unnamed protein product [Blepharisma stoltei]|uniref:Uncharacterized protein n=1 Tax=Blepharisma stoltei TaxID=1481888 RepID=A0AAU9K587_9CILI|nr:unnamed protein product [Blepharisma stoltei]